MNLTTSRSNVPNMVAELENVELNGLGEASSSQMDSPSSHHIKFSASTKPSEINLCGQASPDTACDSASNDLSTAVSRRLEMLNSAGSSTEEVKLDTAQASLCGVGNIRWSWLQRFATKRWMLFFMCWFCLVQGMICNGLVPSVLSTIELRYGFRTSQVGSLMLFYDVGYIIFCVPVSYFGGRHSKPTFLSVGLLLLAIGSFTFTWPQFVPTKDTHKLEVSTCAADEVARLSAIPETCVNSTLVALERVEADGVRSFYLTLFCIAHFLHGVGATTLYSVGVSYIDENVNPAVSSAYIGVFYAFAIFGPAIGFVLSGRLLLIPANFLTDSSSYDSTSATFVGAWWVGFLLTSFLAFIAVLPVLCFPRVLPSALQYHQRRLRVASVRASVRASRSHSRQPSTGNVLAHSSSANNALDKSHHNNSSMPGHHSIISRQESGSGVILPAISLPSSLSGLSDVPTVDTRVTVTSTGNNGVTTKTTVDDEQVCEPEVLEEDVIQDRSQTTVVDMVMTVFPPPQSFDKPLTPHQHMYKVKFQKLCELCTKLWNDLQHIPKAVSRLLTNVTFMLITLAAAFEGILITGVSTYMAKYLERQFSVGASYSSVLLGCIMVPVAGIAAMSSGFVVKHYQLSIMQTLKFCIVACFGCLLLSPMFFVFCDHVPMAGVESDYLDWNHGEFNRTHTPGHQPSKLYQLDNECNLGCKCSPREFHPVCAYGHDGLTRVPYYSPCYAGCPQDWSAQRKEYFNCTCADSSKVRVVLSGVCTPNCTGLVTFLALFVPLCFCTFTIGVPLLSVVLRVVDYNERSFAMGIQWILVRSIGNMPAAVLFGQLFDISCIQRSNPDAGCGDPNKPAVTEGGFSLFKSRTGGTGSCVSYDNRRLAHLFLGFAVVCQTITMLFLIGAAAWYKRAGEPDFDEPSRVMDRENRRHHSNPSSPGRTTSAKKSRNSAKKLSGPGDSTTIESSLATIGENRDVSLPDVAHMDADDGAVQRNGALHNQ